jgi:hypothetical protein
MIREKLMDSRSRKKAVLGLTTLIVLALPSIFFLLRVPPLWRDSDGFYQLADKPNILQILHWPPLYCFLARIPLLIGDLASQFFSGRPAPPASFDNPAFTDTGVFALVLFQHLLLVASLFVACWKVCRVPITRLAFALLLASQAWLYAFAHCIGTEAFAHPLVLLTAVATVVWIRQAEPNKLATIGLFVPMFGAILCRQINILLVSLPVASLLLIQLARRVVRVHSSQPKRRPFFATLLRAVAIGAVAVLGCGIVTGGLCAWYKVPYRSRIGYVFQWRLDYLTSLSRADREQRLSNLNHAFPDKAVAYGIQKFNESFIGDEHWQPETLSQSIFDWLRQETAWPFRKQAYETDVRLNRIARQFLLSGDTVLYSRIGTDSLRAFLFSPADICREPFRDTDILRGILDRPNFGPVRGLASLNVPPGTYDIEWRSLWYCTLYQNWPICLFGIASIIASGIHLLIRPRSMKAVDSLALALAFSGVAAGFVIMNCSLTSLLPRYAAPSCILLLVALAQAFDQMVVDISDRTNLVSGHTADP